MRFFRGTKILKIVLGQGLVKLKATKTILFRKIGANLILFLWVPQQFTPKGNRKIGPLNAKFGPRGGTVSASLRKLFEAESWEGLEGVFTKDLRLFL